MGRGDRPRGARRRGYEQRLDRKEEQLDDAKDDLREAKKALKEAKQALKDADTRREKRDAKDDIEDAKDDIKDAKGDIQKAQENIREIKDILKGRRGSDNDDRERDRDRDRDNGGGFSLKTIAGIAVPVLGSVLKDILSNKEGEDRMQTPRHHHQDPASTLPRNEPPVLQNNASNPDELRQAGRSSTSTYPASGGTFETMTAESYLAMSGYSTGPVDGIMDEQTQLALQQIQAQGIQIEDLKQSPDFQENMARVAAQGLSADTNSSVAFQTILTHEGHSPGVIDGRVGSNSLNAYSRYTSALSHLRSDASNQSRNETPVATNRNSPVNETTSANIDALRVESYLTLAGKNPQGFIEIDGVITGSELAAANAAAADYMRENNINPDSVDSLGELADIMQSDPEIIGKMRQVADGHFDHPAEAVALQILEATGEVIIKTSQTTAPAYTPTSAATAITPPPTQFALGEESGLNGYMSDLSMHQGGKEFDYVDGSGPVHKAGESLGVIETGGAFVQDAAATDNSTPERPNNNTSEILDI